MHIVVSCVCARSGLVYDYQPVGNLWGRITACMVHSVTKLYCRNCRQHTDHRMLVEQYATACTVCWCQTNQVMRTQAASNDCDVSAPDGGIAEVVENTPDEVTFFVGNGGYSGYYTYYKTTGKREVRVV